MSDKRRDQTGDTEPYGGGRVPDSEYGPTIPYYDSPILPIGKDDEADDEEPTL